MNLISRGRFAAVVLMVAAGGAFAQPTPSIKPMFEVATVKPVDMAKVFASVESLGALGIKVTAQHATILLPLERMIEIAYGVPSAQFLQGPDWLTHPSKPEDLRMFAVDAKIPDGATPAQFPLMIQALLEDRFKLTVVKSSKQSDLYALVIGKGGPKLEKKEAGEPEDLFAQFNLGANAGGKDTSIGGGKISSGKDGGMQIEASNPAGLIGVLTTLLMPTPVIDKTGLDGSYNIKLTMPPSELAAILKSGGKLTPEILQDAAQQSRANIFAAVERLGLKLESQKGAVEMLVVEHVEKDPTEN